MRPTIQIVRLVKYIEAQGDLQRRFTDEEAERFGIASNGGFVRLWLRK
jgi:hypothetical protein